MVGRPAELPERGRELVHEDGVDRVPVEQAAYGGGGLVDGDAGDRGDRGGGRSMADRSGGGSCDPGGPARQSRPRAWKLTEPVGVTTTWSSSVTSIVFSASRMRPVMSMSALDGSGSPDGWS